MKTVSQAAAGAAIAILMSGCAGGRGGQLPPIAQAQSVTREAPIAGTNALSSCAWSIVPSTTPTQGFQDLYGVEVASNGDAWAVGEGPNLKTLALRWNGVTWTHYPTPNPIANSINDVKFTAVAEVAPNDVWAVGSYVDTNNIGQTLAEHWYTMEDRPDAANAAGRERLRAFVG